MIGSSCFLIILFAGLSSAKMDMTKFDKATLHKPSLRGNATSFDLVWPEDFCDDWEDNDLFPHPDSCWQYLICWGGELWELECPDDLYFDPVNLVCDEYQYVDCDGMGPPDYPDGDPECPPPGSTEIRFLPSEICDEFYICINGQPILLQCRPGQHWNIEKEFCDDPENAGCIDSENPPPLPDCPINFVGQVPHPHNCNWFIHCDRGSRSIQQCRHLHYFDAIEGRCIFYRNARCIKDL